MAVCNDSNAESQLQIEEEEPYYLQLWKIQRKKKDGTWSDELAEKAYQDLQELHQKQLDEHGVDNLTPQEAFSRVLEHRKGSHHQRGMGQGVLSFSTYQKKVIPKIDIHERIETKVNRRVAQIHESYEARLRALEETLGSSNAQVSVNNIVDILIFLESNHCTLNITN